MIKNSDTSASIVTMGEDKLIHAQRAYIKKEVIIRSFINGPLVGTEFASTEGIDKALGFYLFNEKGSCGLKSRCSWSTTDPLYMKYHDTEWGVPLHDDRGLFEFLILDGAQAGLSWITILRKRQNYRKAFDYFDPHKIAGYDSRKVNELLSNEGIVRNKLKINATVQNAVSFLAVQKEFGSFDKYIWRFVGGETIKNKWKTLEEIPAQTRESAAMSTDLKRRGFKFCGPTICHAFMQAAGLVNDHLVDCFRYEEV